LTGSISLYDKHGERLHTIYVGVAPQCGKEIAAKLLQDSLRQREFTQKKEDRQISMPQLERDGDIFLHHMMAADASGRWQEFCQPDATGVCWLSAVTMSLSLVIRRPTRKHCRTSTARSVVGIPHANSSLVYRRRKESWQTPSP
jgi:hypothetical protein